MHSLTVVALVMKVNAQLIWLLEFSDLYSDEIL